MDETVSMVQGIEKPTHKKALIIAIPLIILLPLACLVLTYEIEAVSPGNSCKNMVALEGSDDNVPLLKEAPGMPAYAGNAKLFGEGR